MRPVSRSNAVAHGAAPAQLLEAFLRDLRAGELQLPVLPDSVSRVMPLIGDPEVDIGALATLVELLEALEIDEARALRALVDLERKRVRVTLVRLVALFFEELPRVFVEGGEERIAFDFGVDAREIEPIGLG